MKASGRTLITVEAIVLTTLDRVWEMYTSPNHITQWNFASDDWQCPTASNDMKVGGKYKARMEAKDGIFGFDFEAIYDEFAEREGYIYSLADGRKVHTRFAGQGEKTKITITFDAESENSVEMQRNGWQSILNNFKKYAETTT